MPLIQQQSIESLLQQSKTSAVEKKLLLKKISMMTNLPTPSATVMKVMLLLRDEDVKISQLVPAIEKDQSLVAQILKLVNSGYYGLRKAIDTVERAVALLGILNIKHVVYSASIMEFFSDEEQLEWNHSYSSSTLMANLIKDNEIEGVANLPMAMIMHDLGKVVLRRFSPKKYSVVIQHSMNDKLPVFRIEDAMLQINHADVGAMLLEKWDTTDEIVKPVLYHHCEDVPPDFILETALVQFVNWVDCTARGIRSFEPSRELLAASGIEEIDKDYWLKYQSELIEALEKGRPPQVSKTTGRLPRANPQAPAAPSGDDTSTAAIRRIPHLGVKEEPPPQGSAAKPASSPTPPIKRPEEPPIIAQAKGKDSQQPIKVVQMPPMTDREAQILKTSYRAAPTPPQQTASPAQMRTSPSQPPPLKPTQVIKRPERTPEPVPQAQAEPPAPSQGPPPEEPLENTATSKIPRNLMPQSRQADSGNIKTQKLEPRFRRNDNGAR